jgi:hypothetical protein
LALSAESQSGLQKLLASIGFRIPSLPRSLKVEGYLLFYEFGRQIVIGTANQAKLPTKETNSRNA